MVKVKIIQLFLFMVLFSFFRGDLMGHDNHAELEKRLQKLESYLKYLDFLKENVDNAEAEEARANKGFPVNLDGKALKDAAFLGNATAPINMIFFSSFSCGYCRLSSQVVKQLSEDRSIKIRFTYMHFNRGGTDKDTAQYLECAGEQGKFWPFYFSFFARNATQEVLSETLRELKIDEIKHDKCVKSNKYSHKVDANTAYGQKLGVNGTPSFILNGAMFGGHRPVEFWYERIAELKK